ncbi:site-2 protease family protein [Streptomyces sp. ACA25]|uniref:site-2 protease family protein n=1 Tax=Streptomyces sp. ACA25 TaxID=3022596 RepID=UPI0023079E10|nr:site-2 protease family protein [Streptomyces sp. ACA25]MDB1087584.1 site-2 protease family protein [Streptomyces sp. ACA25]
MRATFMLGRIAGIKIGVHWSVVVIFGLIWLGLAAGRFPAAYPDRAEPVYAALGLVTALVFFASLLAHELAHALVARRNGVGVEDIVLWLLGGAAKMKSEAPNPGAELRISGVGPLVSLVLGIGFGMGAVLLNAVHGPGLALEAVVWLAAINILLALFNTIPAAPLDGGRLLRAFLWWRTGDRLRATRGATLAGQVFGWLLIALGLYLFLWGAAFGGLWLALIGWFLIAAASMEGRQARLQDVLSGVRVREAMTPDPVAAPGGLSVTDFLSDARYRYRHSAFPVVGDDGAAAGLLTLEQAQQVPDEVRATTRVSEVLIPLDEVRKAAPEDALVDLLPQLEPGARNRVLVLEAGRPVGIVSPSDVSRTVNWLVAVDEERRSGRNG